MKYKLNEVYGSTLYQIEALKDFSDVKKGDKGGFVSSSENLSQFECCWIYGGKVTKNAKVEDNAIVANNAIITGDAYICGNAKILDNAFIEENAVITGNAIIKDNAHVGDNVTIYDFVKIEDNACVFGCVSISGHAVIKNDVVVMNCSIIKDSTILSDKVYISKCFIAGNSELTGYALFIDCNLTDIIIKNTAQSEEFKFLKAQKNPAIIYNFLSAFSIYLFEDHLTVGGFTKTYTEWKFGSSIQFLKSLSLSEQKKFINFINAMYKMYLSNKLKNPIKKYYRYFKSWLRYS